MLHAKKKCMLEIKHLDLCQGDTYPTGGIPYPEPFRRLKKMASSCTIVEVSEEE